MLLSYGRALAALELATSAREQADLAEREIHPAGTPPRWAADVMTFGTCQVEAYHSEEEASRAVIREILTAAAEALASRGRFVLVIPGGRTFLEASRLLTTGFLPKALSDWHIFITDEHMRAEDGELGPNALAALESGGWADLLAAQRLHPSQFHTIRVPRSGGVGAVAAAAREYEQAYASALGGVAGADLVILGMGSDCHVASILPRRAGWTNPLLSASGSYAEVSYPQECELPTRERVSITLRGMNAARRLILFCLGSAKAEAAQRTLTVPPDVCARPASVALSCQTKLICDSAVASGWDQACSSGTALHAPGCGVPRKA